MASLQWGAFVMGMFLAGGVSLDEGSLDEMALRFEKARRYSARTGVSACRYLRMLCAPAFVFRLHTC